MSTINIRKEIGRTVDHYNQRIKKCEISIENANKLGSSIPKTVPELKVFIKKHSPNETISNLRKDELIEKAKESVLWRGRDAESRIKGYKEQIEILEKTEKEGAINKFQNKYNISSEQQLKPVINYRQLNHDFEYPEPVVEKLYKAIKKHEKDVCVLAGGGGSGANLYYINGVEKSQITKDMVKGSVSTKGYMLKDGLQRSFDYCGDFPKDDFIDLKSFNPRIASWQIHCFKPQKKKKED
jgi:hypothetical protein